MKKYVKCRLFLDASFARLITSLKKNSLNPSMNNVASLKLPQV